MGKLCGSLQLAPVGLRSRKCQVYNRLWDLLNLQALAEINCPINRGSELLLLLCCDKIIRKHCDVVLLLLMPLFLLECQNGVLFSCLLN